MPDAQRLGDHPLGVRPAAPVWKYIRNEGFFGLVILPEHGGKGFCHTAQSEIVMKISTRSISAAVTVMVPRHLPMNSVFMNEPTWGDKVFIPMDQVIGGQPNRGTSGPTW